MKDAVDILNEEITRLRQRVVELEGESGNLRKQLQTSYEQEVNSRGHEALRDARDKWMRKAMGAEKRVKELEAKIESNRKLYAARDKGVEKDAERYRWGLEHPSLMANIFIKWRTQHNHYNHRNPGVHPSEAIDAAMGRLAS